MSVIVRLLLFLLVVISSTQLVGIYFPIYFFVDELLLFLLMVALVFQKHIILKKSDLLLSAFLILFLAINTIINFYKIEPLAIKFGYYFKSILPFLIIPYFSKKFATQGLLKAILYLLILISSYSLIEFYILQFVDINFFGENFPFKIRNGYYRAMSLTGHPISLGILNFLGIIIINEFFKNKRKFIWVFLISLLLTGSRIPLLLTILYGLYSIRNYRLKFIFGKYLYFKKLYILSIPSIFLFLTVIPYYFDSVNESSSTRIIAIEKGIKLLQNPINLFFGTGIGSYGTYESLVYGSETYSKVNFPLSYRDIILENKASGIETFFFMSLVEMGIFAFILYFILIFGYCQKLSEIKFFLMVVFIFYCLVYPLYTFPFIFLINIFFPNFQKIKHENSSD
jgi:hypothetical protein